ncbi:MAG: hypothetical protein ACRD3W_04220 [Terriglobales bacterium]
MSKFTFRLFLVAWLIIEVAASLVRTRTPTNVVQQLYEVFGRPVRVPQWLLVGLAVVSAILFLWAIVGLFLFWRGSRLVFVLVLLAFAAAESLQPFYIIRGWNQLLIHVRLALHGFMIALIYFGRVRQFFATKSEHQAPVQP